MRKLKAYIIDSLIIAFIIVPIILIIIFALFSSNNHNGININPFQIIDLNFNPLDIALDQKKKKRIDTNIVLVNLGELDRDGIARQINNINKYKPAIVAIDAIFIKDKGEKDTNLAIALSQIKNLVLACNIGYNDSVRHSINKFSRIGHEGYANFFSEGIDEKVWKFKPFFRINNTIEYHFASKIVELFSNKAFKNLLKRDNFEEIINYTGNSTNFHFLDVNDTFQDTTKLKIIKDKIVLIGFFAIDPFGQYTSMEDVFKTPISNSQGIPDMPGVVIHANIISMILNNDYINQLPYWLYMLFINLFCFLNTLLLVIIRAKSHKIYTIISIPYLLIFSYLTIILSIHLILNNNLYINPTESIYFIGVCLPIVEFYLIIKQFFSNRVIPIIRRFKLFRIQKI